MGKCEKYQKCRYLIQLLPTGEVFKSGMTPVFSFQIFRSFTATLSLAICNRCAVRSPKE